MPHIFILLFCLFTTTNLFANGGGYSKGVVSTSSFQPMGVDQIQMLSERLEIDLHIEHAEIRIEYLLHNPGKKITVECGFPAATANFSTFMTSTSDQRAKLKMLENFSISADDDKLKVSILPDDALVKRQARTISNSSLVSWHVVKIPFSAGQTRRVSVRYHNPYYIHSGHISDEIHHSSPTINYLFSAAGLWAGPIKQGTVLIKAISVKPEQVKLSHPKRFTYDSGCWKWSFSDFEPTLEDDLVIHTGPEINQWDAGYLAFGGEWRDTFGKGATWFRLANYTAQASSFLTEENGKTHTPENLYASPNAAWVEGKAGDGIGEYVTLTLEKPAQVSQLGIQSGYTETEELYLANSRPSELGISINGNAPFRVHIPDECLETRHYWIDLPASDSPVKSIKLEILAIYPGTTFQDTAISDIRLLVPLAKAPKIGPSR